MIKLNEEEKAAQAAFLKVFDAAWEKRQKRWYIHNAAGALKKFNTREDRGLNAIAPRDFTLPGKPLWPDNIRMLADDAGYAEGSVARRRLDKAAQIYASVMWVRWKTNIVWLDAAREAGWESQYIGTQAGSEVEEAVVSHRKKLAAKKPEAPSLGRFIADIARTRYVPKDPTAPFVGLTREEWKQSANPSHYRPYTDATVTDVSGRCLVSGTALNAAIRQKCGTTIPLSKDDGSIETVFTALHFSDDERRQANAVLEAQRVAKAKSPAP